MYLDHPCYLHRRSKVPQEPLHQILHQHNRAPFPPNRITTPSRASRTHSTHLEQQLQHPQLLHNKYPKYQNRQILSLLYHRLLHNHLLLSMPFGRNLPAQHLHLQCSASIHPLVKPRRNYHNLPTVLLQMTNGILAQRYLMKEPVCRTPIISASRGAKWLSHSGSSGLLEITLLFKLMRPSRI